MGSFQEKIWKREEREGGERDRRVIFTEVVNTLYRNSTKCLTILFNWERSHSLICCSFGYSNQENISNKSHQRDIQIWSIYIKYWCCPSLNIEEERKIVITWMLQREDKWLTPFFFFLLPGYLERSVLVISLIRNGEAHY